MSDVSSTDQATYVKTMKWDFDGYQFVARNLSDSTKDKLTAIFQEWGIGFSANKHDCKGNHVNMIVTGRQFNRVKLTIDLPKETPA